MNEELTHVGTPAYYPDLDGWITTLEHKLDHILADYVTSNADQSTIFQGKVSSYIETCSKFWQQPEKLAEEVEMEVRQLLKPYFMRVEVTCTVHDVTPGSNAYNLRIEIMVSDDRSRSLNTTRILYNEDSKLIKALTYSDQGVLTNETYYNQ